MFLSFKNILDCAHIAGCVRQCEQKLWLDCYFVHEKATSKPDLTPKSKPKHDPKPDPEPYPKKIS